MILTIKMKGYQFIIIIVFAAFAVQNTLGGKNRVVPHEMIRSNAELHQRFVEDKSKNVRPPQQDVVAGSNHRNIHPENYLNQHRETLLSQSENNNYDGTVSNNDHRSSSQSEIETLVDAAMDVPIDSQGEQLHSVQRPTDNDISVELISGSGVYINKKKLIRNCVLYKHDSQKLMLSLLEEMIYPQALATGEIMLIPKNMRNTIAVFVHKTAEPKMNRFEFDNVLNEYLSNLRTKYIIDKASTQNRQDAVAGPSHHQAREPPQLIRIKEQPQSGRQSTDPDLVMELISESGVYINKLALETITKKFNFKPYSLMKHLFNTLIEPHKLATMQVTKSAGFNNIPGHITIAVKEYVDRVTGSKQSHAEFRTALQKYLWLLRNKYGIKKQKRNKNTVVPSLE